MFKYRLKKGELETLSVIDYQAFKYYRENSKRRNLENTPNYVEHGKILSLFYKKVGEKIVEHEAGVFIKNLGYFSGIVDMKRNFTSYFSQKDFNLNRNTDGYKFFLVFLPISVDSTLREWVADGSFSKSVRTAFSKALLEGKKYMFTPSFFIGKYHSILKDE